MIKAIVTDIEGTTSSISFVKEVLFPYSRQHMETFIITHQNDSTIQTFLQDINCIVGKELSIQEQIAQLIQWIDEDKKITPLKAIQGLIWKSGFAEGAFKHHMYEDAVHALRKWHREGFSLYIFSSGSIYAQQLLFRHTAYGDLTPLFTNYFDTTIGAKRETAAYRAIVEEISDDNIASEILFLSDVQDELDAAKAVGMQTYWIVRDGKVRAESVHRQVTNFEQIVC